MKSTMERPESYTEIKKIDIQKDKKTALLLHGLSLLLMVLMVLAAHCFVPMPTLLDWSVGPLVYFVRPAVLLAGMFLYIFLRELTHGFFIRLLSGSRAHYGFAGLYIYAGSKAYFDKKSYLIIDLVPLLLCTVVILILNCVVPISWFWVVYIIQIINVSGAPGSFYVDCKLARMPKDLLIQDMGVSMTIYSCTK